MKRFLSILMAIILSTDMCLASSVDTIYEILNRKNKTSNAYNLIFNALNKEQEIKIIKEKEELNEYVEEEEKNEISDFKLNIKNRKNDYILGLDISKWNGDIDWEEIKKANIEFVIIRAGYGSNYVDPYFKQNIENAIDNDIIIGVYWFSYAHTTEQAKQEADKCYDTIKKYKDNITLPVFWDFEYDSVNYANRNGYSINKKLASNMADVFCKEIETKGFRAGIYTNIDYANRYFTEDVLKKYHTWIAQWTSSCTYKGHYIIWQRSDSYYINGKKFDLNYLYYKIYEDDVNEK